MDYIGDFSVNQVVYFYVSTNDNSGGRVNPSSGFELDDIKIYKNDSAVERNTTSGLTIASPSDSLEGVHRFTINTNDNTDPGFFAAGNDYTVILYPDETVDGQLVSKALGMFSIENRFEGPLDLSGYAEGFVYLEIGAGNTNTVLGEDGTIDNPVSSITAAKTLADQLSKKIKVIGTGTLALGAIVLTSYEIVGQSGFSNLLLDVTGTTLEHTTFRNIGIIGTENSSTNSLYYDCFINSVESDGDFIRCAFDANINLGTCVLKSCYPYNQRSFFSCKPSTIAIFHDWIGSMRLDAVAAGNVVRIDTSGGEIEISAGVTGGSIFLGGIGALIDSKTGGNVFKTSFLDVTIKTSTLADNATNNTIIAESNWNALRANHQVADSFGEHVLANMIQWAGSSTIDTVSLTLFAEILLAYTTGRFVIDFPAAGNITFYKQDNTTVLFTMDITATERTRL